MRGVFVFALLVGALTTLPTAPAQACSISYKKGYSPDEIKKRGDIRRIEGVYRLTEVLGDRFTNSKGEERIRNATLVGTIAGSGKVWKTIQGPPDEMLIEICGCDCWYNKPEADAKGLFWIKRVARNGRYQLMLWEGDYLRAEKPADAPANEETVKR